MGSRGWPLHGRSRTCTSAGVAPGTVVAPAEELPQAEASRVFRDRTPWGRRSGTLGASPRRLLRLKSRAAELMTETVVEHISERIKAAREHGDIRENAEIHAAKNDGGLMGAKIRRNPRDSPRSDMSRHRARRRGGHGMIRDRADRSTRPTRRQTYLSRACRGARSGSLKISDPSSPFGRRSSAHGWSEGVHQAPAAPSLQGVSSSRPEGRLRRSDSVSGRRGEGNGHRLREAPRSVTSAPPRPTRAQPVAPSKDLAWPYRGILAFLSGPGSVPTNSTSYPWGSPRPRGVDRDRQWSWRGWS